MNDNSVYRVKIAKNQQDFCLALVWHSFVRQVALGVENPTKSTADTPVAPLDSNPDTAFVALTIFFVLFPAQ